MIIDLIGAIWKAIDLGARSGAGVELNSLQCGVLVEKEHALRAERDTLAQKVKELEQTNRDMKQQLDIEVDLASKRWEECQRLDKEKNGMAQHINTLNNAMDSLGPLVARAARKLPPSEYTFIVNLREALNIVTAAQNKEYISPAPQEAHHD